MYQINKKCLDDPNLDTCKDKDTLEKAYPLNKQINLLEKIANETSMSREQFKRKNKCLFRRSRRLFIIFLFYF